MPCLSILPAGHKWSPCASTIRQQVCGVINKSPGWPRHEVPLHAGERPSCVGSDQSALTEGDACAWQNEPRSRHVVKEQRSSEEWMLHPLSVQKIWEVFGKVRVDLFASEDNSHYPIFYKVHGCPGPRVAQSSALCFLSNRSATSGTQASQGATAQAYSNSPPLEEPAVDVRVIPAARSSPVVNPLETGPLLSSERHAIASMARVISPACVAAQREPFDVPENVLSMMAEARAPST